MTEQIFCLDNYRQPSLPQVTIPRLFEGSSIQEVASPIIVQTLAELTAEIEAVIPGFVAIYNHAAQRVAGMERFNPLFTPPAIFLCETAALRTIVRSATRNSKAPRNQNRGIAHYHPYLHAIYFSIDEIIELLQLPEGEELVERVIVEEMLHAITTYIATGFVRCGFIKFPSPQDPTEAMSRRVKRGVYHWKTEHIEADKAQEFKPSQGDEVRESQTEHLVSFVVALLFDELPYITFNTFAGNPPTPHPFLLIRKSQLAIDFGHAFPATSLLEASMLALAEGQDDSIERHLVQPLSTRLNTLNRRLARLVRELKKGQLSAILQQAPVIAEMEAIKRTIYAFKLMSTISLIILDHQSIM